MDLLGSILGSMDKPPAKDINKTQMYEKQRKQYEAEKNKQREELNRFRSYVEERLGRFIKDDNRCYMEFQPLDQVYRSIVYNDLRVEKLRCSHDISETAGLFGMSFGTEEDRYVVVYKKEHLPSEDEVQARKNGETWNKETAKQYAERSKMLRSKSLDCKDDNDTKTTCIKPASDYNKKYMHIFGNDATLDAARKTEVNRSYGYVPSANKKDVRSIEQTMADISAKKRLKTQHPEHPV